MRLYYDSPKMELLRLLQQDVITGSGGTTIEDGKNQSSEEGGVDWGQLAF